MAEEPEGQGPPRSLSFLCPFCSRRSYHPRDVAERFCSVCGFVDDVRLAQQLNRLRKGTPEMAEPLNTGLIGAYLALAKTLGANSTASDYARANGLALQCMMELPSTTWIRIVQAIQKPTYQSAIDLTLDLRAERLPEDPLSMDYMVFHAPGAGLGRQPERRKSLLVRLAEAITAG